MKAVWLVIAMLFCQAVQAQETFSGSGDSMRWWKRRCARA